MLFGTAVGLSIKNIYIAILVAFLSHYFLDLFPHIEYNIKSNRRNAIIKILTDLCLGFLLIFIFSRNQSIAHFYAFVAIIPDGLTVLGKLTPNKILTAHTYIHTQKIHFLKHKKISNFWRVATQTIVVIISIILLRL
jgi:hypothetical protein